MIEDITYLGKIIRVDSSTIEVEISEDIPSAAPIVNGRLYKIGQIGTFVKIPVGNISTEVSCFLYPITDTSVYKRRRIDGAY